MVFYLGIAPVMLTFCIHSAVKYAYNLSGLGTCSPNIFMEARTAQAAVPAKHPTIVHPGWAEKRDCVSLYRVHSNVENLPTQGWQLQRETPTVPAKMFNPTVPAECGTIINPAWAEKRDCDALYRLHSNVENLPTEGVYSGKVTRLSLQMWKPDCPCRMWHNYLPSLF